jgi:hypothetical protein
LVLHLDIHDRPPSWDAASWKILTNADRPLTTFGQNRREERSLRQEQTLNIYPEAAIGHMPESPKGRSILVRAKL